MDFVLQYMSMMLKLPSNHCWSVIMPYTLHVVCVLVCVCVCVRVCAWT